jgi:hypothetical protein
MRQGSQEMRWFFKTELTSEVVNQFYAPLEGLEGTVTQEEWPQEWRYDDYLVMPDSDAMGIKLRDEPLNDGSRRKQLQFKGLLSSLGSMVFARGHCGVMEQWVKWSFKDENVTERWSGLLEQPGSDLVRVEKKRLLRKIRLDAMDRDEEVPLKGKAAFIDRGFQIELTKLRIRGENYWTLCFEAFPLDNEIHEDFMRNAGLFLNAFSDSYSLNLKNSQSYPTFLRRFV